MKANPNTITLKVAAAALYVLATLCIIGGGVPALISARDSLLVVVAIILLIAWMLTTVWLAVKVGASFWKSTNEEGTQE